MQIEEIPFELLLKIIDWCFAKSFLNFDDFHRLFSLRLVSKKWKGLVDEFLKNKDIYLDDFDLMNSGILKYFQECPAISMNESKGFTDIDLTLFQKIKVIDLSNTAITDESLRLLPKGLEKVILNYTNITDEGLRYLTEAHTLNLSETDITDLGISYLNTGNLINIDLSHCKGITDEGLKMLSFVQTINLSCTNVTDEGLKYLKSVSHINLEDNEWNITDRGLAHLSNATAINLKKCCVTGEGLVHLKKAVVLNLSGTEVTDESLFHLRSLQILDIVDTQITEKGLNQLPDLREIRFSDNENLKNQGSAIHLGKLKRYVCTRVEFDHDSNVIETDITDTHIIHHTINDNGNSRPYIISMPMPIDEGDAWFYDWHFCELFFSLSNTKILFF